MQIKTTMRYNFTSVRMVIIEKIINNKSGWGCGEKEKLCVVLLIGAITMENSMKVPQKIKNTELSYDPAVSLLGIYLMKTQTLI